LVRAFTTFSALTCLSFDNLDPHKLPRNDFFLHLKAELDSLFRPFDEIVQALRLGMASGEGWDGGDVIPVFVPLDEDVELCLHLSTNLRRDFKYLVIW